MPGHKPPPDKSKRYRVVDKKDGQVTKVHGDDLHYDDAHKLKETVAGRRISKVAEIEEMPGLDAPDFSTTTYYPPVGLMPPVAVRHAMGPTSWWTPPNVNTQTVTVIPGINTPTIGDQPVVTWDAPSIQALMLAPTSHDSIQNGQEIPTWDAAQARESAMTAARAAAATASGQAVVADEDVEGLDTVSEDDLNALLGDDET